MEKIKKAAVYCLFMLGLGCGGKNNNTVTPAPTAAQLTFPASDAACLTEAQSAGQSNVTFSWKASANTDSYELSVKNLLTGDVSTKTTSATTLSVALAVNTPFSWSVTSRSKSSASTAVSATWKFYNAGPGIIHYAPFPAEIVAPQMEQAVTAGKITLKWTGSDADNDISGYDVYFGTQQNPAMLQSGLSADSLAGVSVEAGNTYFWKVVTHDAQGNTSYSAIYTFRVN